MKVRVLIIHAFSITGKGGNGAGVVFNADNFSSEQKQTIAQKIGLPETAFVSQSAQADFKLDFFTPSKQIPHCGHATIATFSFLKQTGIIKRDFSSKETIDGVRRIVFKNGMAFMEQRKPVFKNVNDDLHEILDSVLLDRTSLAPGLGPIIVDTGNSFLIVPIKNDTILASINYNRQKVYQYSEKNNLIGYYLYTHGDSLSIDAASRMFAPFFGIDEESATGMGAGTLAAYLYDAQDLRKSYFQIEQGRFMNPPSKSIIHVHLEISSNSIENLYVGGESFVSEEKTVIL